MTDSSDKLSPERPGAEQFAARCAHDFNNLLTGIMGNLELMQNRARRNGVKEFDGYLESARSAAGRAASFAQRMLVYSGRAVQEPVVVPVNRLVADMAEVLREPPPEPGAPLELTLADDAGNAFCDPIQLEIALSELLANAREAGAGPVRIGTGRRGGCTVISVTDTGPGMAAETVARAAEPFFTTRSSGAGKGLGLAIAERFARQAGGALELESRPGAGTTARLVLPDRPS